MNKKDQEAILNWDNILLKNSKTKNKGVLFEDLIETLLKAQFDENYWKRTQTTNDGKKDFVHPDLENATEWLECKNYKENLSINIISPTLILGAIEGVSRIYIYSRSPLNDNALEDICVYGEKHDREIIVYDGRLLEYCIYEYKDYFNSSDLFDNVNLQCFEENAKENPFRVFYSIRDLSGKKIPVEYTFKSGEPFIANIIIQGHVSKNDITIALKSDKSCLKISNSNNDSYIKIINSVEFGKLTKISIQCETLIPGRDKLQIIVKSNSSCTAQKKFSRTIQISDAPYCFLIPKCQKTGQDCINRLFSQDNQPIILYGNGGTGKSSLLKFILSDKGFNERFTVLNINLDTGSDSIIRNVIQQIMWNTEEHLDYNVKSYSELNILSDMLEKYLVSYEKFAEDLFALSSDIKKKNLIFIIDDAQKLSHNHIKFINTVKEKFSTRNKAVNFIFCLNDEQLDLMKFLELLCWDEVGEQIKCTEIQIQKFNKDDIISFFRCRYGLTDFEDLFLDFDKKISALEISKFAYLLEQNKIIDKLKKQDTTYVVLDKISFQNSIIEYLYSENFLWKICRSFNDSDFPDYILKFVYLNGEIKLNAKYYAKIIRRLINAQLLKADNDKAVFFHDKIRENVKFNLQFYPEDYCNIFESSESKNIAKVICAICGINFIKNAKTFLAEYFISHTDKISPQECFNLCNEIIENLENLYKHDLAEPALNYIKDRYKFLNYEIGRDVFSVFLYDAYRKLINAEWWRENGNIADRICFLFKKNLDRLLSQHKNKACLKCSTSCINKIENLYKLSDEKKYLWLFHFHNRRAIAKDRLNKDSAADYNKSYVYADKLQSHGDVQLQKTVDEFHRYYSYGTGLTKKEITVFLKDLIELKKTFPYNDDCLTYHIGLYEFMLFDKDLHEIRKSLQKVIERNLSPFYCIKSKILIIYSYIAEENFNMAYILCDEALRFSCVHQLRTFIYKLTYIQAFLEKKDSKCLYSSGHFSHTAFISLKQMLNTFAEMNSSKTFTCLSYEAKKMIPLARNLIELIKLKDPDCLNEFTGWHKKYVEEALTVQNESSESEKYKFVFHGMLFPDI